MVVSFFLLLAFFLHFYDIMRGNKVPLKKFPFSPNLLGTRGVIKVSAQKRKFPKQ